jgi:hypothetical protein
VLPCLCLFVVALVGEQVAQAQAPCNVVISSPASGSQWTIGQPVSVSAGLNGHQTISPSFVKVDGTQVCTLSASNPSCLTTVNGLALGSHNATWGCGGGTAGGNSFTVVPKTVTGYINPKYMIVGVTYAPPGPSSSVSYLNSTIVSTTNSVSNTFTNAFMTSLTTAAMANLKGWQAGISTTISSGFTQTSTSSNSLELDESVSRSYSTSGAANPYTGINHDYDIVWVWLNPVELFTLNQDAAGHLLSLQWNGHGVSTLDQPSPDIYPMYVGWLNGDIAMTPSQAAPIRRTWAAGELWPTGKGPGLTGPGAGTEFETIAKADPYWQCTPHPTLCPATPDATRYTLTPNNPDLLYLQAPVGGTPITQVYTDSYTTIATQAQGGSYEATVGFAFEKTFGGSIFGNGFKSTLKVSDQISEKNTWDHKLATTNTSTATITMTGPPCVVVGNTCNPVYNKSTQFDLYEDSLYGTFFLNPVN